MPPTHASTPKTDPLPRGLVLFPPGTDPAFRRRRTVFLAIYLVVAALLVWPVYTLAGRVFPLILGLPFALAWVVGVLAIMFGALLWLFHHEAPDAEEP